MRLLRHNSGFWIRSGRYAMQDAEVIREVVLSDGYRATELSGFRTIVDIGAHIGTFASVVRDRNPMANIICIEALPDNIPCLQANVGMWASIINAACTYEVGQLYLASSLWEQGKATGGSFVTANPAIVDHCYKVSPAGATVTLESVMDDFGINQIDVLKLDCEGSEFSILQNFSKLKECAWVIGEYHGRDRWEAMRREVFGSEWAYEHLRGGEIGTFRYRNKERT